jgi:hypothetical protein
MRSLLEDEPKPQEIEIPPDGISLDLLRAVYRSNHLPLTVRLRAAVAALPHEVPRLGVSFVVNDNDIAALLDQRLKRIAETKLMEAKPTGGKVNGEKVDARLPPPIPDRRFRRV